MFELIVPRHGLEFLLREAQGDETGNAGVCIEITSGTSHINLRGNPQEQAFIDAVETVLSQALPIVPNTTTIDAQCVFWLGPDEWLITTTATRSEDLVGRLHEALKGIHVSINDISGGQVAFRLAGPRVRDLLAKGCTLDFHADAFGVGVCAQSGLAKANVLIGVVDDAPTFEVIVRRSFSDYLLRWLRHVGSEYGIELRQTPAPDS